MVVEIKNFQQAFDYLPEGVRFCNEQIGRSEPGHFEHLSGNLLLHIPPLLTSGEITVVQAELYVERYKELTGDNHVVLQKVDERWKIVRTD